MEVILLEKIEKLGQIGDIVTVKVGFARNYLLPQRKALRATEKNKSYFEGKRADLEANNLKLKSDAKDIASRMEGMVVTLIRQAGDAGQLYGSVNSRNIAMAISDMGFKVSRQQILLTSPIKTLGLHSIKIQLHPEIFVKISINVARSEDEAKTQAKTGHAVLAATEAEHIDSTPNPEDITKDIFEKSAKEKAIADIMDSGNTMPPEEDNNNILSKSDLPSTTDELQQLQDKPLDKTEK
ncbi:MAG: 50S ribosomal protein L9 [Alphaproteobacteria bacterium MarineAlpha3_Bin5]|nr:50S ribosomal protein L9 [Magnetovibrio sp.]PPR77179.1 MAG: 50S ribosomal protein L9 [Alphaproteobacteria bacterium MarineAlpha3_Bin5]